MYTYGPVPSRRLGHSLGVSPIPPKTCSYTCVYCQLGKTTHLQVTRESFFPKEDILAEIVERGKNSTVDYVTFVGDGEPTLYRDLGWLIGQTRERLHLPTAVITNGSLLSRKDVRQDLQEADVVLPTLDAGNEDTFRAINRPHRSISFITMLQGLIDFSHEYHGQMWLEIMLVKGINDTREELLSIKRAVDTIAPARVYIVIPIRPPTEPWVEPPLPETILMAQDLIGQAAPIIGLETGQFGLQEFSSAPEAIREIGARHPLRREQADRIERSFGMSGAIDRMLEDRELIQISYQGETFLLPGHFVRGEKTHKDGRRAKS